ncbi:hypothetical protein ABZW30_43795 [Kitasatospora sp. NPDC004669]|uniref:hypothetical protein n=1 Tax=Kitasatospora sp. NPDC004669 TaxID=3154555 RepID=UPI0033A678A5
MFSCLFDGLLGPAAGGHQREPYPEELPFLLAAARFEGVEVGHSVFGAALVGVQGAQRVDDPVLGATLGRGAHHLDRLVGPAVPCQEPCELHRHVAAAGGRLTRLPVHGDRTLDVTTLLQQLRETLRGVPERLGRRVGAQFLDPVVPGQQMGQRVTAIDRHSLWGAQQGDRLVEAALAFTDLGEQIDGVVRLDSVAPARRVATTGVGFDAGDQ